MVPGKRGSGSTSERATTTTLAPSAAKAKAMSLPIPREAPATIATFPASFIYLALPLRRISPSDHLPAFAIITDCGACDRDKAWKRRTRGESGTSSQARRVLYAVSHSFLGRPATLTNASHTNGGHL